MAIVWLVKITRYEYVNIEESGLIRIDRWTDKVETYNPDQIEWDLYVSKELQDATNRMNEQLKASRERREKSKKK